VGTRNWQQEDIWPDTIRGACTGNNQVLGFHHVPQFTTIIPSMIIHQLKILAGESNACELAKPKLQ